MNYHLPPNYIPRLDPIYDNDVRRRGADVIWQPDVIPAAVLRAREASCTTLIDIGCGNCQKLTPHADEFDLVGFDHPLTIARLAPFELPVTLIPIDLDAPYLPPLPDAVNAWIICSDVIEHLLRPEHCLSMIRQLLDTGALGVTISTPDRAKVYRNAQHGPPRNRAHVREWTLPELVAFLEDQGFTIDHKAHTRSHNQRPKKGTCLIHAS